MKTTTTNIIISLHAEIKPIKNIKFEIVFSLILFSLFNLKDLICLKTIMQLKIQDNKFPSKVKI